MARALKEEIWSEIEPSGRKTWWTTKTCAPAKQPAMRFSTMPISLDQQSADSMPNRYVAERGIPTVPVCPKSNISLRFNGRFLSMSGSPARAYAAVSGRPTESGAFDYSQARQRESREGPIPPGRYWIQPSQMWTNHWYNLAPRAAWGDHRITIHVFPGTNTYDRGGFFIHGGTHAGSAGCINLRGRMENFVRDLQAATAQSSDCYIPLTVTY